MQTLTGPYNKNRDKLDMDSIYKALNIWWWFVMSLREVLTFLYRGVWKYFVEEKVKFELKL